MIATYEPGLNGPLVAGVDVGGTLYEHVTPTDRSSLVGQIAGLVNDAWRHRLGLPEREGVGER